jgi:hypothetical protein
MITLRHTTLGKSPLDEGSARRRDLYLTTHNTHNRAISMSPLGFEPIIPTSERPQTHALDRAANGIGIYGIFFSSINIKLNRMSSLTKKAKVRGKQSAGEQKFKTIETQYILLFTICKQTEEV